MGYLVAASAWGCGRASGKGRVLRRDSVPMIVDHVRRPVISAAGGPFGSRRRGRRVGLDCRDREVAVQGEIGRGRRVWLAYGGGITAGKPQRPPSPQRPRRAQAGWPTRQAASRRTVRWPGGVAGGHLYGRQPALRCIVIFGVFAAFVVRVRMRQECQPATDNRSHPGRRGRLPMGGRCASMVAARRVWCAAAAWRGRSQKVHTARGGEAPAEVPVKPTRATLCMARGRPRHAAGACI